MKNDTKADTWFGIDMHVHTPASLDYRGNKDEKEYYRILLSANRKSKSSETISDTEFDTGIRIIAITDHNSIEGFKYLLTKKDETLNLVNTLKSRGHQINDDLQEEAAVYESVYLLMGVEVKVYPGVHLQIVFSESVKCEEVIAFLNSGLEKEYEEANGDPDVSLKWRVDETFDEIEKTFSSRALVIAPHIDRSNGLLEVLKGSPQAKMSALKHPYLKCLSFNNIDTREHLINKVFTQHEYKRSSPIAYIQSSDFHGENGFDVGHVHTKIDLHGNKICFDSIVTSLLISKNVKCSIDFVKDIYRDLTKEYTVKQFKSYIQDKLILGQDDYRDMCDMVCAYLNTKGGIIEITGTVNAIIGKSAILEEAKTNIKTILNERLQPFNVSYKNKLLQQSTNKMTILFLFKNSKNLHMSDGKVLVLKNGLPCPAQPNEIEYIVARNLNDSYGITAEMNLENLSYQAKRLSKSQSAIPITVKCSKYFSIVPTGRLKLKFLEKSKPIENIDNQFRINNVGISNGTIGITGDQQSPRLDGSYLRFSIPTFKDIDTEEDNKLFTPSSDGIILVPGGAAYYAQKDMPIYITQIAIFITSKSGEDIKLFLAWFKSSFFIWHCLTILGSQDIFDLLINRRPMVFPTSEVFDSINSDLSSSINNILIEEKKFVDKYTKHKQNGADKDIINKDVDRHNNWASQRSFDIDMMFYKAIEMSSEDVMSIHKSINELDIFDSSTTNMDEFKKKIKNLDTCLTCHY